jgi:hypothetical protein
VTKATSKRATPREKPKGYRQTVYLGLKERDLADLKTVVALMRSHPIYIDDEIGLAKAARFAIRDCARRARADVTTG